MTAAMDMREFKMGDRGLHPALFVGGRACRPAVATDRKWSRFSWSTEIPANIVIELDNQKSLNTHHQSAMRR